MVGFQATELRPVALHQSEGRERLMTAPGHVTDRGLLPGEALFPAVAAAGNFI